MLFIKKSLKEGIYWAMKRRRILIVICMIIGLLQYVLFCKTDSYIFSFAMGIYKADGADENYFEVLYLVIPYIFISLFCSGRYREYMNGYGRLLIVRNASKKKIMIKQLFWLLNMVMINVLYLTIVNCFISEDNIKIEKIYVIRGIIMYALGSVFLVYMQYFFEIFMEEQIANAVVIVYYVFANIVGYFIENNMAIKVIFVPVLMSGVNNDSLLENGFYNIYVVYLVVLLTIESLLIVNIASKKDVF